MYVRRDPSITAWRGVPGFSNYTVSDTGIIMSRATHRIPGELKAVVSSRGYLRVKLCCQGKVCGHPVHRIVGWAFLGAPPTGQPYINHINGDKMDNRAENLEWCSAKENTDHSRDVLGKQRGEKNPSAKLKNTDIPVIRARIAAGETFAAIARDYGVTYPAIRRIKTNPRAWGG